MAGGVLEAAFQHKNIKAWFRLAIDLMLSWKPFYYSASFFIGIGGSFTLGKGFLKKSFELSLSASLRIWGPEFSGIATVKLSLISFEIKFGGAADKGPEALDWLTFKKSFLPISEKPKLIGKTYTNELCTLNINNGLLKTVENKTTKHKINVVNPKEFAVSLDTPIPISETTHYLGELDTFGIASMGVIETDASMKISITKDGIDCLEDFILTPVKKSASAALWGKAKEKGQYAKPDVNGEPLPKMLMGFAITPKPKKTS